MEDNSKGKYVGYMRSLEGSGIGFHDDIEFIKGQWCMGMKIFESDGLDMQKIKELFPDKPELGVVLDYFEKNLTEVYSEGRVRFE